MPLQCLYLGIELEFPRFCLFLHDGFFGADCIKLDCAESMDPIDLSKSFERLEDEIIKWLSNYARTHRIKFAAAGIGLSPSDALCRLHGSIKLRRRDPSKEYLPPLPPGNNHDGAAVRGSNMNSRLDDMDDLPMCEALQAGEEQFTLRLPARLWQSLDILPFLIATHGRTLDERACQAVRKSLRNLAPGNVMNIPMNSVGFRHEVEYDQFVRIADAEDYKGTVPPDVWRFLEEECVDKFRLMEHRLCFFSSTSQGGGVALMRHGMLRLAKLLDLDLHWFVSRPNPEVFEITKHKFHNILQGVAEPCTHLTSEDKWKYEAWSKENVERYWEEPLTQATMVVIDDPQLAGIIPHVKRLNKTCKIVFRCHIHIHLEALKDPNTEAAKVWSYLWSFIQNVDAYVFHPVVGTPECIPKEKLYVMGASTDLLDGLNKPLRSEDIEFYLESFNNIVYVQNGHRVDWRRPYILQVARFDPSKGIQDLLEMYKLLCERIHAYMPLRKVPQLVITGVGSIDDPDGVPIFEDTKSKLQREEYASIRHDVILARLPPCDQMLNAVTSRARIVLQLSTMEGFEIKVTEALCKGIPVVVYDTGGIPIQVKHGQNGYIVKRGDVQTVSKRVEELLNDEIMHSRFSQCGILQRQEIRYFTVAQLINWLVIVTDSSSSSTSPSPSRNLPQAWLKQVID